MGAFLSSDGGLLDWGLLEGGGLFEGESLFEEVRQLSLVILRRA